MSESNVLTADEIRQAFFAEIGATSDRTLAYSELWKRLQAQV